MKVDIATHLDRVASAVLERRPDQRTPATAGIAIPFLAAALALSRARQLSEGLAKMRPWAGFVASAVMAAFGLILMTDNFHTLSDFIYPLLHLPTQSGS